MNVKPYLTAGGELITGTTTVTGKWRKVRVIASATFDTGTLCNITSITGTALPALFEIDGSFTAIKLSGGSVMAFK